MQKQNGSVGRQVTVMGVTMNLPVEAPVITAAADWSGRSATLIGLDAVSITHAPPQPEQGVSSEEDDGIKWPVCAVAQSYPTRPTKAQANAALAQIDADLARERAAAKVPTKPRHVNNGFGTVQLPHMSGSFWAIPEAK
jgi:hypothetical protein